MLKISLLLSGCILLILQQYIFSVGTDIQYVIILCGILLLGVPHGAADLLVAAQNAEHTKKYFSKFHFLSVYIGRLLLFAVTIWFFPVPGTFLFILFAAYHFGETDLYQFKTQTFLGKIFVVSYGLLILSVMLLHHFEEVKSFLQMFQAGNENMVLLNWLDAHRYIIISVSGMLFFTTTFIYFLKNNTTGEKDKGEFLVRLVIILFILFNLPMLLGFTFYFVVWHSVLSLHNIITYLHKESTYDIKSISKQIVLYSLLAIGGICLFGVTGFMFNSSEAIVGYFILGLAVLTVPHMQIMHDMYNNFRCNR